MTKIEIRHTNKSSQVAPILLNSIQLTNILSFGPETPEIPLGSLNVLIGPNGSGKSNLIEAIALLRSSATSLSDLARTSGGVEEWIWKGSPDVSASINAVVSNIPGKSPLRHLIQFAATQQTFQLTDEVISSDSLKSDFYEYKGGQPRILVNGKRLKVPLDNFELVDSVLAQRRDPERYPEITYLANQYSRISLYREWEFGRNSVFRVPQRADMRIMRLEEDFSNLGLFLNRLHRDPVVKKTILKYLRSIYEGMDDFGVDIVGGFVQVFITEGKFTIPATRLSDGTLRYLCLLAILCDPKPPPLICIEEPELGLHPDILPTIADLLVEASTRTQLIVTTHSEMLVDAMTDQPDSVLVCEKHNGQTQLTRLSKEDLSVWLEKYRLGELWMRGQLGGMRW